MSFRQDVAKLQKLANNAFCQTGTLVALADSGQPDPDKLQRALEQTAAQFESAALEVRKLCERYSTGTGGYGSRDERGRKMANSRRLPRKCIKNRLHDLDIWCRIEAPR